MSVQNPHPLRWSNEINLGHVLQAVVLLGGLVAGYVTLYSSIQVTQERVDLIERRLDRDDENIQRQLDLLLVEIRTLRSELREIERQRAQ